MEDKQFILYQHPFQQAMKKVIIIETEVITVADKSKALANDSLQEPHVRLAAQRAQPITSLLFNVARSWALSLTLSWMRGPIFKAPGFLWAPDGAPGRLTAPINKGDNI